MGTTPRREPSFVEKRRGDTLINAVIGAAAGFVLSFTGVGIILGGGIAGYLQNRGKASGAKVGAISGVVAITPAILLLSLFASWIGSLGVGIGAFGPSALFGAGALVVILFVAIIGIGLSALGGFVGGAIADDRTHRGHRSGGGVENQWDDEGNY